MNNHEQRVRAEQVRIMYSHSGTLAVSHPCAAGLIVWVFWDVVAQRTLLVWLACVTVVSIARMPQYLAFVRSQPNDIEMRGWGDAYTVMSFVQGCLWGTAWLLFIPQQDPLFLVVVATWIMGLSASAVIGYCAYITVLLAFFVPVVVPGTVHLFLIGGQIGTAVGIALVIYAVVVLRAMLPVNKSLIDAMSLNFALEAEIVERKKIEDKLREMSIKDGLTDLANRRRFDEVLEIELRRAQRVAHPLSLLLIDIDYFKAFNDTYGHQAGDACLRRMSRVVERAINRPGDLASRYGGEEFAVILSNTDCTSARQIAEGIRRDVQAMAIPHSGSEIAEIGVVTISVGVATVIPARASQPFEIIQRSDKALYEAKDQGRNQVVAHC